jgi:hypothetical protein
VPTWPASLIADFSALAAAWSSVRGGWPAAWHDSAQFLAHRRILVDTQAQTRHGMRVVLRTRVRLNGDVQTDILRCWLDGTPRPLVEALANAHFQSVADAVRGWSAARAMIRVGSQLFVGLGAIVGIPPAIRPALEAGWESLVPALLANRWVLFGIASAAAGPLLRWALRLWLRWKFRGGLSIG